jgi:vesicular inhibitory amino acid transporter
MLPKYGYPRALNIFALWMIVINPVTKFGLCSRPVRTSLFPLAVNMLMRYFQLNVTIESLLVIGPTLPHRILHSQASQSDLSPKPKSPGIRVNSSSYITIFPNAAKERRKGVLRILSRLAVTAICVGTAVVLPGFGKVMAFLGSFSAFLICIILPVSQWSSIAPYILEIKLWRSNSS